MYCTKCGHKNDDGVNFCERCGATMAGQTVTPRGGSSPSLPPKHRKPISQFSIAGFSLTQLIFVFLGIAVVIGLIAVVLPRMRKSNHIFVASLTRNDKYDYYLVRLGEDIDDGELIAEEPEYADNVNIRLYDTKTNVWTGIPDNGGFIPGTNQILFAYLDGEDTLVEYYKVGNRETTELIDTSQNQLSVTAYAGSNRIAIREQDNLDRCYISERGDEAERLLKGDYCSVTLDGKIAYSYEFNNNNEVVVTYSDLKDEVEIEDVAFQWVLQSYDGKQLAYLQNDSGGTVIMRSRRDDDESEVADGDSIASFNFLSNSHEVYTIITEDDEQILYTSIRSDPVAEAFRISAQSDASGDNLIYAERDEDNEATIYSYDVKSGRNREILNGDDLSYFIDYRTDSILIREYVSGGDDYLLYRADIDGKKVTDLIDTDDVREVEESRANNESGLIFVKLWVDDGVDLYVVEPGYKAAKQVLEEWHSIEILDANSKWVVFEGQESSGDDRILYSVELSDYADYFELDDSGDYYFNAVIGANGKSVIYTTLEDDYQIREVPIEGDHDYDELYDEAILIDTEWRNIETTAGISWR